MASSKDIHKHFLKLKLDAKRVYGLLDGYGYDYKEVHEVARVRQDAQRYVRQNVRANSFMEEYPRCMIDDVERNMSTHFFNQTPEHQALQKVCKRYVVANIYKIVVCSI